MVDKSNGVCYRKNDFPLFLSKQKSGIVYFQKLVTFECLLLMAIPADWCHVTKVKPVGPAAVGVAAVSVANTCIHCCHIDQEVHGNDSVVVE